MTVNYHTIEDAKTAYENSGLYEAVPTEYDESIIRHIYRESNGRTTLSDLIYSFLNQEFEMICEPFSGRNIGIYRIRVELDGTVYVYDCTAGHYTYCHNLSSVEIKKAQEIANELRKGTQP